MGDRSTRLTVPGTKLAVPDDVPGTEASEHDGGRVAERRLLPRTDDRRRR